MQERLTREWRNQGWHAHTLNQVIAKLLEAAE
jgi:hypothetical protein